MPPRLTAAIAPALPTQDLLRCEWNLLISIAPPHRRTHKRPERGPTTSQAAPSGSNSAAPTLRSRRDESYDVHQRGSWVHGTKSPERETSRVFCVALQTGPSLTARTYLKTPSNCKCLAAARVCRVRPAAPSVARDPHAAERGPHGSSRTSMRSMVMRLCPPSPPCRSRDCLRP